MRVLAVGRWFAAGIVVAGTVLVAPGTAGAAPAVQPGASGPAVAGTSAAVGVAGGSSAAPRFLSTPWPGEALADVAPGGDPRPPADARRAATLLATTIPVTDGVPERIGGSSRYATAAQIAAQVGASGAVVVANGTDAKGGFDALSANYLAGQVKAPIVLTGGAALEPETKAAVTAALAGSTAPAIYVMGKTDSVSAAEADQLNSIAESVAGADGDYVHRVAGDSRYQTSAMAASATGENPPSAIGFGSQSALPTAILASGTSNADALAAGPLSDAWGIPVLLTAATALPSDIAAAIKTLGVKQLLVLGGTDRVSNAVVAQAQAAGAGRVQRIAGANRFATAAALYTQARTTLVGPDGAHYSHGTRAFVANGVTGFPDALAVGPLAAKLGAPLLTVAAETVDPTTLRYLKSAQQTIAAVTVLGKTPTVGNTSLAAVKSAAGINILAGSDGVVPPAEDSDAQFQAAAAKLTTFTAKLKLARTFLPNDGAGIGTLHPYMLAGWDAAGLTEFQTCDVWMDSTLPDNQLLDIFRHEYIHVLQCRAENKGYHAGYVTTSDVAINGVERGADAGAYLLGNDYMYYVQYGPTAGPLQTVEIATAERLLAYSKIVWHIG